MQQSNQPTTPVYSTKEHWDSRAEIYEKNNSQVFFPVSVSLSNVLNLQQAKNFIEVGCAAGHFSLYYLQTFNYADNFYSVDISSKMIELANLAKSKAALSTKTHHEYIVGSADDLNFLKDGSLDAYVGNLMIHLTPDPNKTLQEAKRVLKEGGRIGLSVPYYDEGSLFTMILNSCKEAGWVPPETFNPNGTVLSNEAVLRKLLEDNGFEVTYLWKDNFRFSLYTEEDIDQMLTGDNFGRLFSTFSEETRKVARSNVLKGFADMKKRGVCPYLGCFSIVAHSLKKVVGLL